VASRAKFLRLQALPADRLTDLQRAARFIYLQKLAFGGKVEGRNFGVSAEQGARFNIEPMLTDIHEGLAGAVLEQLGYAEFIRRYDRDGALFYLDPPYWGGEADYSQDVFGRADFGAIAAQLRTIKGKFLVSINDTPEVREIFAGFNMLEVETRYSSGLSSPDRAKLVSELIISNYPVSLV
jgi:DNA adenine methylase